MNDLQQRIATCLNDEDGDDAKELIQNHAAELGIQNLTDLVTLVLDQDRDDIVDIFANAIGSADAELAEQLITSLVGLDDTDKIFEVMAQDAVVPHHGAILDAFNPEGTDDETLGYMLAAVGSKFSREHKIRVARAITIDEEADSDGFVNAIATLGAALDDDTIVKVVDKMAKDLAS